MDTLKTFSPSKLTLTLFTTWALSIGLLTLGYSHWLDWQYNPNQIPHSKILLSGEKQVTLKLNRYDHYVSSGTINGKNVDFLLDTGSTHIALPAKLAEQLNLKLGEALHTETANGSIEVFTTTLPSLTIGNIEFKNIIAAVNPYMTLDDEVLLGMSVLKQLDFAQKNGELVLTQS